MKHSLTNNLVGGTLPVWYDKLMDPTIFPTTDYKNAHITLVA